jgi:hypothetical protein
VPHDPAIHVDPTEHERDSVRVNVDAVNRRHAVARRKPSAEERPAFVLASDCHLAPEPGVDGDALAVAGGHVHVIVNTRLPFKSRRSRVDPSGN